MDEEVWMTYSELDEVRWNKNGHIVTIIEVDEDNQLYTIDDNGTEYKVSEDELE